MPRFCRHVVPALLTGILATLMVSGCGTPPARVKLSIDLSDEAFCPRGVLADHPDKVENVDVRVGLRSREGGTIQFEEDLVLKVYPASEPLEVLVRQTIPVSLRIGETWRRPLDIVEFVPPANEGNYIAEVSSADGGWASTKFGIWHDSSACPAPGSAPVAAIATPVATPEAAPTAKPVRKSPLQVTLDARWECNAEKGVEDLEVKVRVTNPKSSGRALRGFRPVVAGIDELEPFERTAGETPRGYLTAGSSLLFRSFGWIENGHRAVSIGVLGGGPPLAEGILTVDCTAGAGHRGGGRIPAE